MLTSTSKFFEDNKIVRARALEKCSSAYQTAREITLLLDNNLHEKKKKKKKKITVGQSRRNFETVGTVCNFHSCYKFVLVLHENALVLSLSEACNFFNVC